MSTRATLPVLLATFVLLGLSGSAAAACPGPYGEASPRYDGPCLYAPITPVVPWTAACVASLLLHVGDVGAWALDETGNLVGWTLRTASNALFGTPC